MKWTLTIAVEFLKRRNHVGDEEQCLIGIGAIENIEGNGVFAVGGVEIDQFKLRRFADIDNSKIEWHT